MKTYNKPDFIGIGGARCGSGWLFENLKKHPDVWLPDIKELHYFDRSPNYPSPNRLAEENVWIRLFGKDHFHSNFRPFFIKNIIKSILFPHKQSLAWTCKYFLGKPNNSWYHALLNKNNKITGEISPAYAILNEEDIAKLKRAFPDVKIIYIIRNPVYMAWSAIRRRGTKCDVERIQQTLENPSTKYRSDFMSSILTWEKFFPENQIFIGFYDDVQTRPGRFLLDIFNFLNADVDKKYISELANRKINSSPPKPMPLKIKKLLCEHYIDQLKRLKEHMGGYANDWYSEAMDTINKAE